METFAKQRQMRLNILLNGYIVEHVSKNRPFLAKIPLDIIQLLISFMFIMYQPIIISIKDRINYWHAKPTLSTLIGTFNNKYQEDMVFKLQTIRKYNNIITFELFPDKIVSCIAMIEIICKETNKKYSDIHIFQDKDTSDRQWWDYHSYFKNQSWSISYPDTNQEELTFL